MFSKCDFSWEDCVKFPPNNYEPRHMRSYIANQNYIAKFFGTHKLSIFKHPVIFIYLKFVYNI